MNLNRFIALSMLVFCSAYIWLAYHYPMLPFEKNMVFKPNTMPLGLGAIGIVLSLLTLIAPQAEQSSVLDESTADQVDDNKNQQYDRIRPVLLVLLMIAYALMLRPAGFVVATATFLFTAAFILGERKYHLLIPISCGSAFLFWYLVDQLLGIYMRPWPAFLGWN